MSRPSLFAIACAATWLSAAAADRSPTLDAAHFDVVTIDPAELVFEDDLTAVRPDSSVFTISYQAFLSSRDGDRFALITVVNSGQTATTLDERDVIARLASGEIIRPKRIEGERRIADRGTLLLHFGPQRLPIVKVETRN